MANQSTLVGRSERALASIREDLEAVVGQPVEEPETPFIAARRDVGQSQAHIIETMAILARGVSVLSERLSELEAAVSVEAEPESKPEGKSESKAGKSGKSGKSGSKGG